MKAILSDIHGNLEALRAVLEDIDRLNVREVYCLGDVVGYGPDPRGCLDLVRQRCQVALLGNHERAVLADPEGFTPVARQAALWTRSQLAASVPDRPAGEARWEFLATRPPGYVEGDCLFVHASPRDPVHDYVFPHDSCNLPKMGEVFGRVGRCCFMGHTHLPGVFVEVLAGGLCQFFPPDPVGQGYRVNGRKALVNVGSVGQPRDGDWRACYALVDGGNVYFRRVEYDVGATVQKIRDIEGLDDMLGERLLLGR
jgi:diadenosine tetraphosphatase ApaH/serine/threonine PP2A family protein phosphatase